MRSRTPHRSKTRSICGRPTWSLAIPKARTLGLAGRTPGTGIWRTTTGRPRQLAEHGPILRCCSRDAIAERRVRVDAFAASVVNRQRRRIQQDAPTRTIFMAPTPYSHACAEGRRRTLRVLARGAGPKNRSRNGRPSLISRQSAFVGSANFRPISTTARRLRRKRARLASDDIRPGPGTGFSATRLPKFTFTPRLVAEYNYASGDANPTDGRRGTFDQLYPTAHDKYGLADQVGWRNMHDVRVRSRVEALAETSRCGFLSFLVACRHARWTLQRRRNARGESCRRNRRPPRRPGSGFSGRLHAQQSHPDRRRIRARLSRDISEERHAGQGHTTSPT